MSAAKDEEPRRLPSKADRHTLLRERGERVKAPWLTDADRAEWAVLWRVLVNEIFDHRERGCARCDDNDCPAVRGAIEAAVEWAELRSAHSFANGMRRMQNQIDLETEGRAATGRGAA